MLMALCVSTVLANAQSLPKEVATRATLNKPTIVRYANPPSFLDMLNSQSTVPSRSATSNININGINNQTIVNNKRQ